MAGSIVVVVVVLVVIIVFTVMFLRSRSNDECNKKQPSDCDTLEYRNGEGKFYISHIHFQIICVDYNLHVVMGSIELSKSVILQTDLRFE